MHNFKTTCSVFFLQPDSMRGRKFLRAIIFISLSVCLVYQLHNKYTLIGNSWKAEQLKRQARVQNVCSNHGLNSDAQIPHPKGWLVASEQHFFMCRNHKVGTSTYISTTFQQIANMRKFERGLLSEMFRGTPESMKRIQDNNSVSIAVITLFFSRHNRNNLVKNSKIKQILGI